MSKIFLRNSAILVLLIFPAALSGCVYKSLANRESDFFEQTLPLPKGGSFYLENVNGSITVETWDQSSVIIEAEKKAPTFQDLDEIQIEVREEGDRIEVKTRYPHWGKFRNTRGEVIYRITLPEEVHAELKSVNGRIRVSGVCRDLRVDTVNGGIEIKDAHGAVHATTVNGGIRAMLREPSEGNCRFSTTNGGITVEVSEYINARFEGHTVNGGIHTDLPLSVTGKAGKRLSGRIGNGDRRIQLNTVNGGISLHRI
jgi:DUF4097 and DUF4098 domain-containing protein YvlB